MRHLFNLDAIVIGVSPGPAPGPHGSRDDPVGVIGGILVGQDIVDAGELEFGVQFSADEIASLSSVAAIRERVNALTA